MPASAKAVANRLLELASRDGKTIDPLQMEKLVYLVEGWGLAAIQESVFHDPIEAWEYGPVVPDLYFALRKYGDGPIREDLAEYDYDARQLVRAEGRFAEDEIAVIDTVWEIYGSWTGPQLIKLTHESGGPWDAARKRSNRERNPRIDREAMKRWYSDQITEDEAA